MEKLLDNLHLKLCNELEQVSKKEITSHEELDIIKDLLDSIKNIYKIYKYMGESNMMGGEEMKGNSYAMGDNSYNMRGNSYAMRRSYGAPASYGREKYYGIYYDPNPEYGDRNYERFSHGYSGATKEEMVDELRKMKNEASDMKIKQAISDCISKMEKDN